jgi:UDPglucose--hexose-1-phosphate uridylyltransferase
MPSFPHRRFNPLRREWVLVSPQRTGRPWQGQVEPRDQQQSPTYDPTCYLCPGNLRANGARNPAYETTFAFDNDFSALVPAASDFDSGDHPLLVASSARGICRVLCFSPRHDLALTSMDAAAIRAVIDAWAGECDRLAALDWARYALVFENRGAMMGASNPHPHCQIWTTEHVPDEPSVERRSLAIYRAERGSCLLCDYVCLELQRAERVVCANAAFAAVVPFWAVWPFETILIARQHVTSISALDAGQRDALADILKRLTTRYDCLFETPFPYSMGFHQALRPGREAGDDDGDTAAHDHLHAHFYPPLLRSATIRKFMVGFELLGSPQRDLTPEQAAARLQSAAEPRQASTGSVL